PVAVLGDEPLGAARQELGEVAFFVDWFAVLVEVVGPVAPLVRIEVGFAALDAEGRAEAVRSGAVLGRPAQVPLADAGRRVPRVGEHSRECPRPRTRGQAELLEVGVGPQGRRLTLPLGAVADEA